MYMRRTIPTVRALAETHVPFSDEMDKNNELPFLEAVHEASLPVKSRAVEEDGGSRSNGELFCLLTLPWAAITQQHSMDF